MKNGVFCLTTDFEALKADKWKAAMHEPQGILVVAEGWKPFVFAPKWTSRLSWIDSTHIPTDVQCPMGGLILDSLHITHQIVNAFHNENLTVPAAEYCLNYACGRIGQGQWALPSIIQLQYIAKYKYQIKDCLSIMGRNTHKADMFAWSNAYSNHTAMVVRLHGLYPAEEWSPIVKRSVILTIPIHQIENPSEIRYL